MIGISRENNEKKDVQPKKVFIICCVGRQFDGEYIKIQFEKAFSSMEKAQEYINKLPKNAVEVVDTPTGKVNFYCERGIHEIEVSE